MKKLLYLVVIVFFVSCKMPSNTRVSKPEPGKSNYDIIYQNKLQEMEKKKKKKNRKPKPNVGEKIILDILF